MLPFGVKIDQYRSLLMSAFLESGRSDHLKLEKLRGRFRPEADPRHLATRAEELRIPIRLIAPEILDREVQEGANLGGQILPLGKDCVDGKFRNTIGLKELHQPPRF